MTVGLAKRVKLVVGQAVALMNYWVEWEYHNRVGWLDVDKYNQKSAAPIWVPRRILDGHVRAKNELLRPDVAIQDTVPQSP